MTEHLSRWQDGRRAWERLVGWHLGTLAGRSEPGDDDGALDALLDVSQLRHLLDQAEMAAVRIARGQRRSWAEIATQLGVTRQSAWERWRDLDETAPVGREESREALAAAAIGEVERVREQRRRSTLRVPNLVGMGLDEARGLVLSAGLMPVGSDPDAPPLAALGLDAPIVIDQSPESGARVPAGSRVTLWTSRGGGAGVREPRRPKPSPRSGRAMLEEPADEAVG